MPEPIALWVAPVSNLAGVARHFLDVARVGLPGFRLVVTAPEGPLLDELRALGTPVIPLDLEQPLPKVVAELRRTISKLAPAVVHSHLAKADFLVTMAAAGLPTKLVSSEHHIPEDPLIFHGNKAKAYTRQAAHHARIRRFSQLIAVSESTKRDMLKFWRPSVPVTVVLNGVDRPETPQVRGPGLRVLSLTRLSAEKNVEMTLRAFAKVRETHPEATLSVGGTGEDAETLQELAGELGLGDAATFVGFVDPVEAMATHDVLVQPSKADNLSYTLLDATAHGLGVVASNIGGNGEIVAPQCLVSLGDVDGAAAAIIDQGLHLDRRPQLPAAIPTVAEMAKQIVDVYAAAGIAPAWVETEAQAQDEVDVSVIIPCYNAAKDLPNQLEGLAGQISPPPFEVIVADNGGDPALHVIARAFEDRLRIRVVDASDVQGVSHARNVGAAAARGAVIAFCDADDFVTPHWLRELARAVTPGVSFASGGLRLDKINPPHSIATHVGVPEGTPFPTPLIQTPIPYLGYLEFGFGANLAFGRDDYLGLGGCDETLRGTDDVDICWRAQEAGLTLNYAPDALIDYRLRADARAGFKQRRMYMRTQILYGLRSAQMGRPVRGTSWRWTLTESLKVPAVLWSAHRSTDPAVRFRAGAETGARVGSLEGLVRYRLLRRT